MSAVNDPALVKDSDVGEGDARAQPVTAFDSGRRPGLSDDPAPASAAITRTAVGLSAFWKQDCRIDEAARLHGARTRLKRYWLVFTQRSCFRIVVHWGTG
jgi:hypothetical protein